MKKFFERLNLKKTWWSLLGQLLVEIFVAIMVCGLDLVLSNPQDYEFLDKTCEIGAYSFTYYQICFAMYSFIFMFTLCQVVCAIWSMFFDFTLKNMKHKRKDNDDSKM